MEYSPRERLGLMLVAVVGFVGLNGVFGWTLVTDPDMAFAAARNPVAAAFIIEAFLLVALLAYLLARWRVSNIHWAWFVLLSVVGGIAFSLPVVLLWSERRARRAT